MFLTLFWCPIWDTLLQEFLNVSACGYGAIATLMSLTKKLDGKIELIRHSTSAEVSRDYLSVVGYRALVAYYWCLLKWESIKMIWKR